MLHFLESFRLTIRNGIRYIPLLQNLISRDLKKKYRKNILGYVWCILNPLLVMIIMTIVFSRMFHNSIDNYPVYLFTGRMTFSFIIGGAGSIMRSIVSNGSLMRKTRVPYYIFPLSSFFSSFVDYLFTLIAFVIVLLFTRTPISAHILFYVVIVLEMSFFTLGLGLILAIINIYVRDIDYIWAVTTVALMYLTPLFYPVTSLSETIRNLIERFNPLYLYIVQTRLIFLQHELPTGEMVLQGFLIGFGLMIVGCLMYNKAKNTMILHV